MKKIITFLSFILFFCCGLQAQVKTVYYSGDEVILDSALVKTYATSFAVYGKLSNDSIYVYKRYDIYNSLMSTGTFKDEGLKIPHGKFVYYLTVDEFNELYNKTYLSDDQSSFIYEEGQYLNGLSVGRWKTYYPDGKVMRTVKFENGLKQGEFVSYDQNGKVETLGNYINDKREGEWLLKRGKKKVFFVNDIEQKRVNGKVKAN